MSAARQMGNTDPLITEGSAERQEPSLARARNLAQAALDKHQKLRILRVKRRQKVEGKKNQTRINKQWANWGINPESVMNKTTSSAGILEAILKITNTIEYIPASV